MSSLVAVEWLRPLVENNAWDFAVVWKFGDDPTRFIEWLGCCCKGSCCENSIEEVQQLKDEMGTRHYNKLDQICRDTHFQHPLRTKACYALSQLPFVISLYSGARGDVAISQQPRWLTQEETGTQVLIPTVGGLIELFAAKLIPKDMNVIEFITAHCYVSVKQEVISAAQSYTSGHLPPSEEQYRQRWSPLALTSTLTSSVHLHASNWSNSQINIEGPSSGSNPSSEYPSFGSNENPQNEYLKQPVETTTPTPETKRPKGKQQRGLSSDSGGDDRENKTMLVRKNEKEGYRAKNLVTERKRRNKLKNGLFTLRSLVPKITKMDRASIVGDAINYIKELQGQVEELKDEVKTLDVMDCENIPQSMMPKGKVHGGTRSLPLTELNQSSYCTKQKEMEVQRVWISSTQVQADVKHIDGKDWLIKLYCEQKPGEFSRLMEAIHSYGLQVSNANVTTLDGKVLIILEVEATEQDMNPMKLKDYLIAQTG